MPKSRTTSSHSPPPAIPTSLEAKLVLLGSQGVGKTSLVNRFITPSAPLSQASSALNPPQSTIGASFHTKRVLDPDTSTTVRLQIWDTAGQERFRSISRLYYRGAHAGLLVYDITDEKSWQDMKDWLKELKEQCSESGDDGPVIHVVGTKSDIVAEDPSRRKIPFERTIAYVAEQLYPSQASTPPAPGSGSGGNPMPPAVVVQSPDSKRSSGFWGQDVGWDSCHEVNAKDGEGIEEVFRVIARKLVEQRNRRLEREERELLKTRRTPGSDVGTGRSADYFAARGNSDGNGSFRVGVGDKRKSWLGLPAGLTIGETGEQVYEPQERAKKKGKCC